MRLRSNWHVKDLVESGIDLLRTQPERCRDSKQRGHTMVGAHALVTENKEFPDGVMLLGAPARVARELTDEEIGLIRYSAQHYAQNAERYLESLAPFKA